MQIKNLENEKQFRKEKMLKANLFATPRLFYDLYCLEAGQFQKVHAHEGSDKVYLVLEGKALITIGTEEKEILPSEAVLAPAGVIHGVKNTTTEKLVLLVTMSPPPTT